ncbi:hypothetical protein NC661_03050 [Aquibacillus koreensis]|uniref:Uncharacterized protein n=1 Tax=Aquibacillus koreensis TaxID=279446 RepID=A0A9X3WIV3_9BACI|nr:hypothetical protein [Aquibacillus koreensis]MCT2536841.1 hypothetical protein [Aquibacillus koreensis]MDC3419340.1 hypothetical protein [Aquibacillus koreensis]
MDKYKDRVLQEDNLVYSFFGDYNIVISKETGYEWMGKSSTDLFYVMIEKDRGADQEQLLHLRVFTTIGLTQKYLSAILPDYVFDEMLIRSIVYASNGLALQKVSEG